jgi:hypothetical protein
MRRVAGAMNACSGSERNHVFRRTTRACRRTSKSRTARRRCRGSGSRW